MFTEKRGFAAVIFALSLLLLSSLPSSAQITGFQTVFDQFQPLADDLGEAATVFGEQTGLISSESKIRSAVSGCGNSVCDAGEYLETCPADCLGDSSPPVTTNVAYLVGSGGLRVFDISNPTNPTEIGAFANGSLIRGIEVIQNRAYLSEDSALIVADISNPASPVELGRIGISGNLYGLDVDGFYAYVASFSEGMKIVDISNPSAMSVVGAYSNCSLNRAVSVQGNYAFLPCSKEDFEFQTLDISDRTRPAFVARGWAFGISPTKAAVYSNKGFLTSLSGNFEMFDISNITGLPNFIGRYYPWIGSYRSDDAPFDVAFLDNHAYLASGSRFEVIDVSGENLSQNSRVSSIPFPGSAIALTIDGNYAYVADNFYGLRVIDISTPSAPAIIGTASTIQAWDVIVMTAGSTSPPQTSCGNGICDASENVSSCFIDCATGSSGNSCSEIAPLQNDLQSLSAEEISDAHLISDAAAGSSFSRGNIFNSEDGGQVFVDQSIQVVEQDVFDIISNSYFVQFYEEPVVKVDGILNGEISSKEANVKHLRQRISGVNTNGIRVIPGSIQKFFLNNELSSATQDIETLKSSKQNKLEAQRIRVGNEHASFRRELKRSLGSDSSVKKEFSVSFNGALLQVSGEAAKRIESLPGVKSVAPERNRQVDLMTSVGYINADSVWNLEDANGDKITGKGTTIAIIDTGVDYTHPDLGGCFINPSGGSSTTGSGSSTSALSTASPVCGNGLCEAGETAASCPADCSVTSPPPSNSTNTTATCKVVGGWDFVNNDANPMDDHGHGTHVAATAAGNGVLKGVSPDAKIYAYKVCNSGGSCAESHIIAAIERALDPNQDGNFDDHADVISISLGGGGTPDDPDALAVDNAFNNGVVVSVSAGNSGPSAGTIKCPSCARNSISVAAWCKPEDVGVNSYCNSQIASFSSRGPVTWSGGTLDKPDISAPGVNICAAEWDSAWSSSRCLDSSHVAISGTSMAAPHISGAAALLIQAHPDWTPQQVKDAIMNTAVDLGLDKYTQGSGLVDVLVAVQLSGTLPQASITTGGTLSGVVSIIGTASGTNFTHYILEYAPQGSSSYTLITSSASPVIDGTLGSWNTGNLLDGFYNLRLTVFNSMGESNQKLKLFEINNVEITSPADGFSSSSGVISISGTVLGNNLNSFVVEHGRGTSPSSWDASGVSLVNPSAAKNNELLATWNSQSVTEADYYTIRLTAQFNDGRSISDSVTIFIDPFAMPGYPLQLADYDLRSMASADIDGDGEKEIIAGSREPRYLYAINKDGTPVPGWPKNLGYSTFTKPAIADLDNDGLPEIVVASNRFYYLDAYNNDGSILAGWPAYLGTTRYFLQGSPAIGDIDGDGSPEIVVGAEAYYSTDADAIYAFNADGTKVSGWPQYTYNYSGYQVTPSLADLDRDGKDEVIIKQLRKIYVYRGDGTLMPGFPVDTGDIYGSSTGIVTADLEGDGDLEILVGMGTTLYALNADATPVPGWPKTGFSSLFSPPAVGDMNGDGKLEVALPVQSQLYLFDYNGNQLWRKVMTDPDKVITIGNINEHAAPLFADIDNDGQLEVILTYNTASLTVPTKLYAFNRDGTSVLGWPKILGMVPGGHNNPYSTPLLDDVDNDGRYELFIGFLDGKLYGWDLGANITPQSIAWNQNFHDSQNTGLYTSGFYAPLLTTKYHYFQLTDNDCDVNLTLSSTGNHTLYARTTASICDESWDASISAASGSPAVLKLNGLSKGAYAVHVEGYGSYTLTKDRFCRDDTTLPAVSAHPVPAVINDDVLVSASVSDANGLSRCDVCLSGDGVCDIEWKPASTDFLAGDHSGMCSDVLNSTLLSDGAYQISFRAVDIANNSGASFESTFLDRTPPSITSISMPVFVDRGSMVPITASVTDNFNVGNVTASLGAATAILVRQGNSTQYNGFLPAPQQAGQQIVLVAALDSIGNTAFLNSTLWVTELVNFSAPINVITAQYSAASMDMAMDSNVHVVWEDALSGTPNILYSQLSPSGAISIIAKNITNTIYNSKSPSVDAVSGVVHVAWQDDRDGNKEIYYSRLQGSAIVVDEKRVTFNSFDSTSPKVVAAASGAYVFWLDNRNGVSSLYYALLDNNGNKVVQDTNLSPSVQQFDVASASPVRVAYISGGIAYHAELQGSGLGNITAVGVADKLAIAAVQDSYILTTSPSGTKLHLIGANVTTVDVAGQSPSVALAASDAVYAFWGSAMHAKYSLAGSLLSYPIQIDSKDAAAIAVQSSVVALTVAGSQASMLTTSPVEKTAPTIQLSAISILRADSAVISISTSEPTLVTAAYGTNSATDNKLASLHEIALSGLSPSTFYSVTISARDIASNVKQQVLTFTTEAQRNRPALPTTFFGRVVETGGAPLGGIPVTATWTDTNNQNRTATVSSLTQQQASALNNTGLVGYYIFNLGNVLAADGTSIVLTTPDMTNSVPLPAQPGSFPINVTASLIVDKTPPSVSIQYPAAGNYPTPFLYLNYSASEPLQRAEFVLNGNDPVTITGLENRRINFTARLGSNTLLVTATDLIGLQGLSSVSFTVDDKVPPVISINAVSHARNITAITANVSDQTNALDHCEACIGDGCDWQPIGDTFSPGDFSGMCVLEWNTNSISDGNYSVAFRVFDESGNTGTASPIYVEVDNTPPQKLSTTVSRVPGQEKMAVSWPQSSDPEFRQYVLYRTSSPAVAIATIANRLQTYYNDTGVVSGHTYGYAIVAQDIAGNEGSPEFSNETVADVIPPSVSISQPQPITYNTASLPFQYSVSEPSSCAYRLNGGVPVPVSGNTLITAAEGSNNLVLSCADAAGNSGNASVSFTIDTTPPASIIPSVAPLLGTNNLHLAWAASTASDFRQYNVYRSSSPFSSTSSAVKIATILTKASSQFTDTNLVSQATYYYAVTASDTIGNERSSVTSVAGKVADTVAPQLTLLSPLPQLYKSSSVTVSYSANEPLGSCTYSLNSGSPAPVANNTPVPVEEGSNSLMLSCNDLSNNSASTSVSFDADAQAPLAVAVTVAPLPGQNSLSLSWQPSAARDLSHYNVYRRSSPFSSISAASLIGTTASTGYLSTNLISQATYYYAVTAIDSYSNEQSSVSSVSGTVADTTPPAPMTLTASPAAGQLRVNLAWSKSSASDFAQYNVFRSISPFSSVTSAARITTITNKNTQSYADATVASSTTYYYAITASDSSGNENKSVTAASATVDDLTSPVITILQPQPTTYTARNITLSLSVSEPATCSYSFNAASSQPVSGSTSIVAIEGSNSLSVSCADQSGNSGNASVAFSVDTLVPPPVQGLSVLTFNGSSLINATWMPSSASDLSYYKLYISTADFTQASDSMLLTTSVQPQYSRIGLLSEYTYYLAVTAVDVAGNENKTVKTAVFTIPDLNPPRLVIGLHLVAIPGTRSMDVSWDANPEDDTSHYDIYRSTLPFAGVTGIPKIASVQGRLNTSFIDSYLQSETTYWYAAVAVDNSGNFGRGVIPLSEKTADITPPNVSITSPASTTYNTRSIPLQYSSSEPVTCRYSINSAPELPASSTITADEGNNSLLLKCSDAANNNGTASVPFIADTLPPSPLHATAVQVPRKEQAVVSWPQSSDAGFASYKVYRSSSPFTDAKAATIIATIPNKLQLSHTDNNVQSEQTYYYAVTVTDTVGNENTSVSPVYLAVEDLTPPFLNVLSPLPATYTSYAVPLQYSSNEPLGSCSYRLNNNTPLPVSGNSTLNAYEGGNSLLLNCTDLNANANSTAVVFSTNVLPPPPITGLVITWGSARLSWDVSPASDVSHYAIYRSLAPFASVANAQLIATTTGTSYHDVAVAGETTYYYAVTAVDTFGNEERNAAGANFTTPDTTPPAKVAGLSVSAVAGQTQLQLIWLPSSESDFASYNVYRSLSPFSSVAAAALIASIPARNTTAYLDSGLASGTTYYYAVTASDASGNEDKSMAAVSGTVADVIAPNVTTIQVASPVAGQVLLQGLVADSALSDSCEVCIGQGSCSWAPAAASFAEGAKNGTCSYLWSTPNSAGTYSYNFRVSDTSGNSAEGQPRSVEVLDLSQSYTVSIPLAQGWNLVSFPVLPQDNSISSVMQPVRSSYTKVFYFDSASQSWQSHFAEQGIFNPAETLTQVELGKSYWIEVLSNTTLQVTGARASSYFATLRHGWNLIGNPYETPLDAGTALSSLGNNYNVLFSYNASGLRWERFSPYPSISQPNTISQLTPGTGYMIDMIGEAAWTPSRS